MEGRKALAGMAISAVALAAAGELLSPGSTRDFLANVPAAAASLQMHPGYNWGRQMTPTAFMRTLLGADSHVATIAGHAVSAAILVVVGWKAWTLRREHTDGNRVRAIVLAFLAMPLCAPYFMDYDLLLLVVPLAMLVVCGQAHFAAIAGAVLWLATWINVDLVAATRVNGVVLLLIAFVGAVVIWFRRDLQPVGVKDLRPRHSLTLEPACP